MTGMIITGFWLTGSLCLRRKLIIYPEGIRRQLAWLKKQYGDYDILITENGYSSVGYQLDDYARADFYKEYLEQVLLSIKVDNVSVVGYAAWSLIDNFEWLYGYEVKFGLYEVNFEDPKRTRTPRTSAHFYACVIKNRGIVDACVNKKFIPEQSKFKENGAECFRSTVHFVLVMFIVTLFS